MATSNIAKEPFIPEQHIHHARVERLKAISYATLGIISSLAVLILCTTACFFGFGFVIAPF